METQVEVPRKHVAVQASGCSECQSLLVMLDGSRVRCQQTDDFALHGGRAMVRGGMAKEHKKQSRKNPGGSQRVWKITS